MRTGGFQLICGRKIVLSLVHTPVALIDGAAAWRTPPLSLLAGSLKIGIRVVGLRIHKLRSWGRHGEEHGGEDGREEGDELHVDFERDCSCGRDVCLPVGEALCMSMEQG
jgi:hypothetical protein